MKQLFFILLLSASALLHCSHRPMSGNPIDTKNVAVFSHANKRETNVTAVIVDPHSKNVRKVAKQVKTLPKKAGKEVKRLGKHLKKFKF